MCSCSSYERLRIYEAILHSLQSPLLDDFMKVSSFKMSIVNPVKIRLHVVKCVQITLVRKMVSLQNTLSTYSLRRYHCFRRIHRRHAHAWIQIWRPSPPATMCPLPFSPLGDVVRMRIRSYEPPFYVGPCLLKREKIISVALS